MSSYYFSLEVLGSPPCGFEDDPVETDFFRGRPDVHSIPFPLKFHPRRRPRLRAFGSGVLVV